jgi:hypothetical protein
MYKLNTVDLSFESTLFQPSNRKCGSKRSDFPNFQLVPLPLGSAASFEAELSAAPPSPTFHAVVRRAHEQFIAAITVRGCTSPMQFTHIARKRLLSTLIPKM